MTHVSLLKSLITSRHRPHGLSSSYLPFPSPQTATITSKSLAPWDIAVHIAATSPHTSAKPTLASIWMPENVFLSFVLTAAATSWISSTCSRSAVSFAASINSKSSLLSWVFDFNIQSSRRALALFYFFKLVFCGSTNRADPIVWQFFKRSSWWDFGFRISFLWVVHVSADCASVFC